jgi:hypothetical protein
MPVYIIGYVVVTIAVAYMLKAAVMSKKLDIDLTAVLGLIRFWYWWDEDFLWSLTIAISITLIIVFVYIVLRMCCIYADYKLRKKMMNTMYSRVNQSIPGIAREEEQV